MKGYGSAVRTARPLIDHLRSIAGHENGVTRTTADGEADGLVRSPQGEVREARARRPAVAPAGARQPATAVAGGRERATPDRKSVV